MQVGPQAWVAGAHRVAGRERGSRASVGGLRVALGAARVAELEMGDWQGMAAFKSLKKLEQRRLLKAALPA